MELPTGVIPAVRKMKDFEYSLKLKNKWIILLDTRLSQLKSMVDYARRSNKKVLIHVDLIHGLKTNEFGMEFLYEYVNPDGILTTRGNMITYARKKGVLSIQRMFLIDRGAVEQNLQLINRFKPDCIEVLPGLLPSMIQDIRLHTKIPIIAGGLIENKEQVESVIKAGAIGISTSSREVWGEI